MRLLHILSNLKGRILNYETSHKDNDFEFRFDNQKIMWKVNAETQIKLIYVLRFIVNSEYLIQ